MDITRTIKVNFPNNRIQEIELAFYYNKITCDLITIYNDKIYKKRDFISKQLAELFLKQLPSVAFDSGSVYNDNTDCFEIRLSLLQTPLYRLIYEPDETYEIRKYIREHGLFEETNEYVLK